jgi:hypothetical protein
MATQAILDKLNRNEVRRTHPKLKEIANYPPKNREQLVQFAKKQRLYSFIDVNLWGMHYGVNPSETNLIMENCGVKTVEHKDAFAHELQQHGYSTGEIFEPDPRNPNKDEDAKIIAIRHQEHEAHKKAAEAIAALDVLTELIADKGKNLQEHADKLPDKDKRAVNKALEETVGHIDELNALGDALADKIPTMPSSGKGAPDEDLATESSKAKKELVEDSIKKACVNYANWKDEDGNGCDFYFAGDRCRLYGSTSVPGGFSANEACCVCDGGNHLIDEDLDVIKSAEAKMRSDKEEELIQQRGEESYYDWKAQHNQEMQAISMWGGRVQAEREREEAQMRQFELRANDGMTNDQIEQNRINMIRDSKSRGKAQIAWVRKKWMREYWKGVGNKIAADRHRKWVLERKNAAEKTYKGKVAWRKWNLKTADMKERNEIYTEDLTECGISPNQRTLTWRAQWDPQWGPSAVPNGQLSASLSLGGQTRSTRNGWVTGCKIPGLQCSIKNQNSVAESLESCSKELGEFHEGLDAVGSFLSVFSMLDKVLNGGFCGDAVAAGHDYTEQYSQKGNKGRKRQISRAKAYCKKGIRKVLQKLEEVVSKVAQSTKMVPVVGQITKVINVALKLFNKFIGIISKVVKALAMIDRLVQNATYLVGNVKQNIDRAKTSVHQYYAKIKLFYLCPESTCKHEKTLNQILGPAEEFMSQLRQFGDTCTSVVRVAKAPLQPWRALGPLIKGVVSAFAPLFDLAQKIFDLAGSLVAEIGRVIGEVKCCLPNILQYVLNAVGAVLNLALCPVFGAIDGMSRALADVATYAVMKLAQKILPDMRYEIPGIKVRMENFHLQFPICDGQQGHLNFKLNFELYHGLSFDLGKHLENAAGDVPSMEKIGDTIVQGISDNCKQAIQAMDKIFTTCECKIPVIREIKAVLDCFPGDATVTTPSGKKLMSDLKVGDCVLSKGVDGTTIPCDEVYMFGHAEHKTTTLYHRLSLDSGTSLKISPHHFIHTTKMTDSRFQDATLKYAKTVTVGEYVWEESGRKSLVLANQVEMGTGAFNPYTKTGNIIVDGVVASAHSNWFLDSITPAGLEHYLPWVYQQVLVVNRAAHHALGPVAAETLGLSNPATGADFWIENWAVVSASLVVLLVALMGQASRNAK